MLTEKTKPDIDTVATDLWKDNVGPESGITAVYRFPSDEEIRLIYLDSDALSRKGDIAISPFYFGANTAAGIPYRSAIALIRPEEKDQLQPPAGWGNWADAELVWEA